MNSCVVLNYNNLDILSESIPLLLADGLHVVAVDNGSDDGSREYLAGQSGIVTVLNDENLGSSTGRNQGIDRSQGNVLLLDSDILYIRGSYAYLLDLVERTAADCAGFHFFSYTREKEKAWRDLESHRPKVVPGAFAYTHYGVFRAGVFDRCRFDENFGTGWGFEDNDLTFQMKGLGMTFACARARYYHRKKSSVENLKRRGYGPRTGERLKYLRSKWGISLIHPTRSRRANGQPQIQV